MNHSIRRLLQIIGIAALSVVSAGTALAQSSTDTMTLVVPYPPGGSADAFGRLLAGEMGKALGVHVVVDNRAGGSGIVGMNHTARSAPDGRTLLLATNTALVNNIAMFDKPALNIERDLKPVAMVGAQSMLVVARDGAPFRNMAELLAYARANPEKVTRGSAGQGSITHLGFVRLEMQQNIRTTHVPYKGDAAAMTDLLGGVVDLYVGGGNAIRQNVVAGKLQGLAVMGPKRFADLPKVQTMRELGYPDADAIAWFAIVVPRATPTALVERLSKALTRIATTPATVARMSELGIDSFSMDHAQATSYIAQERERWIPLVRRLGVKAN